MNKTSRLDKFKRALSIFAVRAGLNRLHAILEGATDDRVRHLQAVFTRDEREIVRKFVDLARRICGDELRLCDEALLQRIEDLGLAAPRKDAN